MAIVKRNLSSFKNRFLIKIGSDEICANNFLADHLHDNGMGAS